MQTPVVRLVTWCKDPQAKCSPAPSPPAPRAQGTDEQWRGRIHPALPCHQDIVAALMI